MRKIMCGSYPRRNTAQSYLYHSMFEQSRALGYEVAVMDRVADRAPSSGGGSGSSGGGGFGGFGGSAAASPGGRSSDDSDFSSPATMAMAMGAPLTMPLKEHGVDEMLSFQILEFVLSRAHKRPGTIVLTTGDGQPSMLAGGSIGFYRAVEKALANGWSVELYSFGLSLSQNWIRLRDSIAQSSSKMAKFRIIYLDEFVMDLYDESFTIPR